MAASVMAFIFLSRSAAKFCRFCLIFEAVRIFLSSDSIVSPGCVSRCEMSGASKNVCSGGS